MAEARAEFKRLEAGAETMRLLYRLIVADNVLAYQRGETPNTELEQRLFALTTGEADAVLVNAFPSHG